MVDISEIIKKNIDKAVECIKNNEYEKAAAYYEKSADLMAIYAEQTITREVERKRKKLALEWREKAKNLRSGEYSFVKSHIVDTEQDEKITKSSKTNELRDIVTQMVHHSEITWDDIGGLDETKDEIKYALGITLAQRPEGVKLSAWQNILFYGPPGTGKTLLAAATSRAIKNSAGVPAVFYNVKISGVLSKYFGESSKIVSELYGVARDTSPSVVFLDEFESICAKRDFSDSGPERRILSTILSELDGLEQKGRTDIYVLTIAATNRPWDLDPAILSRFEKKILIPLPDLKAREEILEIHLINRGFKLSCSVTEIAELTEGFSGREIERLTKEVVSKTVRELNKQIPTLVDKGLDMVKNYKIKIRELDIKDFKEAVKKINPITLPQEMQKYIDWKESQL